MSESTASKRSRHSYRKRIQEVIQERIALGKPLTRRDILKDAGKARGKNATWRHLNADYRQLNRRLGAVSTLEAREAAAAQKKPEGASEGGEG